MKRRPLPTLALAIIAVLSPAQALAHAADRGFVMLLPTGYYIVGGALAVALSFVVLAFVPAGWLERVADKRHALGGAPGGRTAISFVSFLFLALLLFVGLFGSRDPLSNPLPLTIWTLWWVGLTLAQGTVGNLWAWLNPWAGPYRTVCRLIGRDPEADGPLRFPPRHAFWPAILLFFGFALFELVYPAPDDPARLAAVVAAYWLFSLVMMLAFGGRAWSEKGECFSIFFAMISRLAVLDLGKIDLSAPGARLASAPTLPVGGVLFLLAALSSVSFDGLMRTFFWFELNGLNPLEFQGRSSVVGVNAIGLMGMFALLTTAFLVAVRIGERLAGNERPFLYSAGALVWSIIPISLAYHFSHYLGSLLVNGQYALAALSDPLSNGWSLFGTAGMHVQAGVTIGYQSSWWIWNVQAGAIIGGHVLAVTVAHVIANRLHDDPKKAVTSQLPLAVLMVFYTVFGLWLLSSPTGA